MDSAYLYDVVLLRSGTESILDITLAHNAKVPDDTESGSTQAMVLSVTESLTGRNHDRLSRVDSKRVHVLHVAHLCIDIKRL